MSDTANSDLSSLTPAEAPLPNVFARFIGIITAPTATFREVVRVPRALAIIALVALLMGVGSSAFSLTEKGRQATVDFSVQQVEKMGMTVTDAMYSSFEKRAPYQIYITTVTLFVTMPIAALLMASIFWVVFNAILGGTATYKQVVAVVAHTMVIPAVGALFAGAMNFARGSIQQSAANLGMLLPMLPEHSFAANFAGAIDVFQIWNVIVTAIGLGVLYKRKPGNIATALFIVYIVIAGCVSYFFAK